MYFNPEWDAWLFFILIFLFVFTKPFILAFVQVVGYAGWWIMPKSHRAESTAERGRM